MFVIERLVSFFLFAPRTLRDRAALIMAALLAAIALTGNYTFFNFLTAILCLLPSTTPSGSASCPGGFLQFVIS